MLAVFMLKLHEFFPQILLILSHLAQLISPDCTKEGRVGGCRCGLWTQRWVVKHIHENFYMQEDISVGV